MHTRQISLFAEDNHFEIKKHSSIVQMSSIATLQERKIMNVLLRIAKDHLKKPGKKGFYIRFGNTETFGGIEEKR